MSITINSNDINTPTRENDTDSSLLSQIWSFITELFSSSNESSDNLTYMEYENSSVFSGGESDSESYTSENNSYEEDSTDEILENAVQNYFSEIEQENLKNDIYDDEYHMEDMRTVTIRFYTHGKKEIDNSPYNYALISAQSIMSQTPLKCTRYLYKHEDTYYDIISNGNNAKVISIVDF